MTQATPLAWPPGWARTPAHKIEDARYRFKRSRYDDRSPLWTFAEARDALLEEVRRLGGTSPVLSSNFPIDRYGFPTEGRRRPEDQGVALYFLLKGKATVMAADHFARAEENMRSLALAIEALRALERHGGGRMMERAFAGFVALDAPGAARPWRTVLGMKPDTVADIALVEARYKALLMVRHPDKGGTAEDFMELRAARDEALREVQT